MNAKYVCADCGSSGVKLWREYGWSNKETHLRCAECALKREDKTGPVDENGMVFSTHDEQLTDQIGWLVPAVPCDTKGGFYGYSSVPDEAVAWWKALPTRKETA